MSWLSLTTNQVKAIIANRMRAEWSATPLEHVMFENEAFSPPVDQVHLRVILQPMPNSGTTLGRRGARRVTKNAMILAEVKGPLGQRSKAVDDVVDAFKALFQLDSYEGIDAYSANETTIGKTDDERWHQINVTVPIVYYEVC